jgi:UDP-2-acetamido-2,6-beta-L-arabino-hexul-4-ose reductase
MHTILVTGSNGFIGRSLCQALAQRADVVLLRHDIDNTHEELLAALARADVIYHLAGVNRPLDPAEFETGNAGLTHEMCQHLIEIGRSPSLVLSSSTQAALDNPYGVSKRRAEDEVHAYAAATGAQVAVYRLPNVFGMGCRPNYNSAVATFCHNIAHDLPIQVSDPAREMELVHVDDVVEALVEELSEVRDQRSEVRDRRSEVGDQRSEDRRQEAGDSGAGMKHSAEALPTTDNGQPTTLQTLPAPTYRVTLGRIVGLLESFKRSRSDLQVPGQADGFTKKLYATYLTYLPVDQFSYFLKMNVDARGSFTEFLKTPERGQVSINISKPHITKGNHWHHTKNEKFLVVSGSGVIRLRKAGERTGDRGQRSEIGGQGSEIRGQGSEIGDCGEELPHCAQAPQTADLRPPTSRLSQGSSNTTSRARNWRWSIFPPATRTTSRTSATPTWSQSCGPMKRLTRRVRIRSSRWCRRRDRRSEVGNQKSEVRSQKS